MGLFGFGKKKEKELPMPPPPTPPEIPSILKGDIEPIRFREPELETPTPTIPEPMEIREITPEPSAPIDLPDPDHTLPEYHPPAREKEVVYDRTIPQKEEVPQHIPTERHIPGPSFVAVSDYKKIINDTNTVRAKLMEAENILTRLSDLKNAEERAFEKWKKHVDSIEKKINYVDQLIEKAQR